MWKTLHTAPDRARQMPCSPFRHITESLVLLAVAVIVFRGFAVEGYLISTGSMAPTLLGYHHRITCPECAFVYAKGTVPADDAELSAASQNVDREHVSLDFQAVSRCPNCGYPGIVTEGLPRTEGDQLLVHKQAYEFRDPRRWEVIVFRNPGDPRQAYVKRVVGLPGEAISLRRGNVFVNGQLARKPYRIQQAMCLPVSEYRHQPTLEDPDSQSGWVLLNRHSTWKFHEDFLECMLHEMGANEPVDDSTVSWVGYRHWIHSGGTHSTSVTLSGWPRELPQPGSSLDSIRYQSGKLMAMGALTEFDRRSWLARSDQPEFQAAIQQLFEQSHVAPILDEYGYNSSDPLGRFPVSEFFVSLKLSQVQGTGRFLIELSDGDHIFSAIFDFSRNRVEIRQSGDSEPCRTAKFTPLHGRDSLKIDFSLVDQQVVLAVNGKEVIEPFPYEPATITSAMRRPMRFGAAGLQCRVSELVLSRDVYYTPLTGAEGKVSQLGPEAFFVLGDNSPVSVDSRAWNDPAVPRSSLIGKPLVVHLPSRTGKISWNGTVHHFRLPDFSRVRLVR